MNEAKGCNHFKIINGISPLSHESEKMKRVPNTTAKHISINQQYKEEKEVNRQPGRIFHFSGPD